MKEARVEETKAGQCPKCGKQVADCICAWLESSVEWPKSGNRPHSEGEMSARFSKLKEADCGTTFSSSSNSSSERPGNASGNAPAGADQDLINAIDLAADAIIGGVYKIIRLIGRGGMGEVYLARHMTLGKKCALKVMPPDQVTEVGWQRFQLEAKTVAGLQHKNLVRVTDLGIHEGCLPYCAMEYLDGKNLAEMLAEYGPMPLNKALEIFMQVCDGVDCAHRGGILHRDLKPANIMLIQSPNAKLEVKILDFGLAKLTRHNRFKQSLTAVGDVFGSPYYMSPEQCAGNDLDSRSDIYSIGCTLFGALNWGLPPSDLSLLVQCPHLQRLIIGQLTGSHEQFFILEKLPDLQQLDMPALRYRPDLAADLKLLKRLRVLKVIFDHEWTQAQFLQLRQELPSVQFFMYSRAQEQRQGLWRP